MSDEVNRTSDQPSTVSDGNESAVAAAAPPPSHHVTVTNKGRENSIA